MIHVTLPQHCAYLDGELAEASAELVRRHLSECLECTERFARLEAQDEILARILSDDPDEEFFQRLSASIPLGHPARVERTAPSKRDKPVRPRTRRRAEEQGRSALSPRAAWITATVCCIVAGSAAWVALRHREAAPVATTMAAERRSPVPVELPPTEAEQTLEQTPEQALEQTPEQTLEQTPEQTPEPAPATAPAPKAVDASAPPVVSVPDPARAKPKAKVAPAPPPEQPVERAPRNFIPVRTVITETIVNSGEQNSASAAVAPKASRPNTAPDPSAIVLRDAKSSSLKAARSKLPAAFDKSAEAWERALPLLESSPETLAVARRELAQSRFQAWAAEPTPARREAAIASARQYLLYAPPGPERDQAWTWFGRLKH